MIFEHFRDSPLMLESGKKYSQSVHFKPRGLWLSIPGENDWPNWCRSEEFGLERLADKSTVELGGQFRILHLDSAEEVRLFDAEYGVALSPNLPDYRYPDWERVAGDYDGIIISPYQWSLRWGTDLSWYSTWDVESGCIWNPAAIAAINGHPQTFDELDRRMTRWIDVAAERASNLIRFGTEDPSGGAGRQQYAITHPLFPAS